VPSLDQLASGPVRVSELRSVEVQDLLGRERVELDMAEIRVALEDRVVMVTGAGGSIGSELCRQIAAYHPRKLILLERSEPQAYQIEQELIRHGHKDRVVTVVADILNRARLRQVLATHRPHAVFHAAAHKHVPLMEHQPGEAIQNNAVGPLQLAEAAIEQGVERFILISTDKAINPTSVMGASKRLAEMCIQGLQDAHPDKTRFMAVRFGNVLGSSGSVIPTFQRQIAEGGPVTVTHPDMTRYFMTIPEAVMLVLQSAILGRGGEIFVLDMGQPVKIVDLARNMIELSGLKPDEDIEIKFVGLRPGEKLHEEISREQENLLPTTHQKILRFVGPRVSLSEIRAVLGELEQNLAEADTARFKLRLKKAVPEYCPYLNRSNESESEAPTSIGAETRPSQRATARA
jgi:FlaA1/EpsC-like NDP-sugar epimerase